MLKISRENSFLWAVFARSSLKALHAPPPLLLPLQDHRLGVDHDGAPAGGVLAQDQVGRARAQLGTPAFQVVTLDPDVYGSLLLQAPYPAGLTEDGVNAGLELEPFVAGVSLADQGDKDDVVLLAVLAHVDLPLDLLAVGAGGPGVPLGS